MPAAQVLDSHALLALLRDEPGAEAVATILERAGQRDQPVHMPEVNYVEVQYTIRRKDDDAAWHTIAGELRAAPIEFHPADRFPPDFMFRLSREEAEAALRPRSQFATLKHGTNLKYLSHAFTENGAVMAANDLNSPEAVRMSVFVVRAFVKMRELAKQLAQLEKKLTDRLDVHETAIVEVLQRIMEVLDPPLPPPEPPKRQMGFHWALLHGHNL